jgi:glycogen debranching enzyme
MSANPLLPAHELQEIACPFVEPRIAYQTHEPRKGTNLTLIEGKTFVSTSDSGDISPPGAPDVGFFHDDTRFLSQLELKLGGLRTVVLSSSNERTFASTIELTTGSATLRETIDLPENTIHIRREQLLGGNQFFDYVTLENFNQQPVELTLELVYSADFMDVFQIRGTARNRCGHYFVPVANGNQVRFSYRGLDNIFRTTQILFNPAPDMISDSIPTVCTYRVRLEPGRRTRIETVISAHLAESEQRRSHPADFRDSIHRRRRHFETWHAESTHFRSNNEEFNAFLNTAVADFHALQIPDGNDHIIAAGIPWFATIFGRDSLISSYQSLVLNPRLAAETLRVLARYQGREENDWRDEQPGKILHESRGGEMANNAEIPFGAYYGSADATPLFLVLCAELFNWTSDEALLHELKPAIYKALEWIDRYGDIDGDGLSEYLRRSPRGLINQGWKDSWDANMHADGSVAEPPIALIEVQGYIYDAKYRLSRLLRVFGDTRTADRLKKESTDLARRIEKCFWMQRQGFFAMALDRDKKPLQVISSNVGHLLFSRAMRTERARTVTQRMMRDDMHTGWGWRTLASSEKVFNPLSYHRGSVWPHDNSIIAHGMCLYGFTKPALHTLTTLFHAALAFRDNRLPELFCGVQRGEHDSPVHYPVSCSPQAWASGAVMFMLTSVLGIRPSAPQRELNIMNAALPEWLDHLQVRNLRVGNSRVALDFSRRGERTYCNVVDVEGDKLLVNVAFKKP